MTVGVVVVVVTGLEEGEGEEEDEGECFWWVVLDIFAGEGADASTALSGGVGGVVNDVLCVGTAGCFEEGLLAKPSSDAAPVGGGAPSSSESHETV